MSDTTEPRHCKQCDKILHGRSDQVYCNDTCRNTFNKQKGKQTRIPPHVNEKQIFAIIRNNYKILKKLCPLDIRPDNTHSYKFNTVPKEFDKDYFTSIVKTERGIWRVCFDRGWLEDEDSIILKDFPKKGIIY